MNMTEDDFLDLSPPLVGHILDFLSLTEEHQWLTPRSTTATSLEQQQHQRDEIRRHRTCLQLCSASETRLLMEETPPLSCTVSLDLGEWATNEILEFVAQRMPALQRLEMVSSNAVTGTGVLALSRLKQLRFLDVTFCDGVSYLDTLMLRHQHQQNRPDEKTRTEPLTIRRQPAWMDGRFQTPFENDGQHTYWPDGTFQYERDNCSVGFVRRLTRIQGNHLHVQVQTQPTNFTPPSHWPSWTHFLFRPAVSLLYREPNAATDGNHDQEEDEEAHRDPPPNSVLVAQRMNGNYSLHEWPRTEHWSLPMGQSVFFARDGSHIPATTADDDGDEDNENNNDDEAERNHRYVMVTRIRLESLRFLETTPPVELLERNRVFLSRYQEFDFGPNEDTLQRYLNRRGHDAF